MFPPLRSTDRGDLRSVGITPLHRYPLRSTGPHHSQRGLLNTSSYIGAHTQVLALRFPQGSIIARLVTHMPLSSSMLSETPGGQSTLVFSASPAWPAPHPNSSAHTQKVINSRSYVSDSEHPLFTSLPTLIFLSGSCLLVITLPSD